MNLNSLLPLAGASVRLMHDNPVHKLAQQRRRQFLNVRVLPDDGEEFPDVRGFLALLGKVGFEDSGAFNELLLLDLVISRQLLKPFIRELTGYMVFIKTLE